MSDVPHLSPSKLLLLSGATRVIPNRENGALLAQGVHPITAVSLSSALTGLLGLGHHLSMEDGLYLVTRTGTLSGPETTGPRVGDWKPAEIGAVDGFFQMVADRTGSPVTWVPRGPLPYGRVAFVGYPQFGKPRTLTPLTGQR